MKKIYSYLTTSWSFILSCQFTPKKRDIDAESANWMHNRLTCKNQFPAIYHPDFELDSIFDPFVQGSRTRAGGTGLGLSICKKIINDHHGKIWASNRDGGGAMLSFLVPYEQNNV